MTPLIELAAVTRSYGKGEAEVRALDDVSAQVLRQETLLQACRFAQGVGIAGALRLALQHRPVRHLVIPFDEGWQRAEPGDDMVVEIPDEIIDRAIGELIEISPCFRSRRLFSCTKAWWAQVAAQPDNKRISVLIRGRCQGSNVVMPSGGHTPSIAGDKGPIG